MAKQKLKVTAKKSLAVLTTAALLLSCGMTGLFTANAVEVDETVASAAVGEPTEIRIFNAKGQDITDNPFVYLDNSNRAGGPTSTTVSAKVTDEKGNIVSTDIHASLDPQPASLPYVGGHFKDESTVELYAATYDSKGKETSYKEGTTRLHFTAANGTLYRDITVVVYKPAKDVKLFWGDKNNKLQLNDYCEDNTIEAMAIENHKVQIYSEFVDKDSTDKMEYHVYDGYFSGFSGGKETTKAEITEDGLFTPKENGEVTIYAKAKATETSDRTVSYYDKRIYTIDDNGDQKTITLKDVVSMPKYIHVIIVKENPAKSLSITNNPEILEANETYQLELDKEPQNPYSPGYETGATDVIRWESSNKNVATVDDKGLVTAVGKGDVKITAYGETENVYAECNIRVLTKATAVKISPKPVTTRVGVSFELNAKMNSDSADDEIEWISSDPSTATVEPKNPGQFTNTQTAIVTGVKEGSVTITAKAKNSGREDKCLVTVNKKILSDSLTLSTAQGNKIIPIANNSTIIVYTNNDLTIDARLTGDGIDADDSVVWTVSNNNENVTDITKNAKSLTVHGSIEGTVNITATSKVNKSITKSFNINVLKSCDINKSTFQNANNSAQSITNTINLQRGNLITLKADLRIDNKSYPYNHSDGVVSWTSSNPNVATIDDYGNVRAVSDNGTSIITMTTLSGQTKKVTVSAFSTSSIELGSVTKPVTSDDLPTTVITLNQNTFQQSVSKKITTTVKDQKSVNRSSVLCTWTSSDEEVAVVSENGEVTAKSVGTTIITARSGVVEASCLVSVIVAVDNKRAKFGEVENFTYSPLIKSYEPKVDVEVDGKKLVEDIDYTLQYKNNTRATPGNASATLIVNGTGLYTGKKELTFKIHQKPFDETDFTIAPVEDQKCTGQALKPKVQVECLGTPLEEGVDYTLSYSNATKPTTEETPAVISITGRPSGNYSGEIKTTFNIYCDHEVLKDVKVLEEATYINPGLEEGTCTVCLQRGIQKLIPVKEHSSNPAQTLSFANTEIGIGVNETITLVPPEGIGRNNPDQAITDTFRWESSDPTVISVDSNGNVKGKKKGTAIITAYGEYDDAKAECTVQVLSKKLTGLEITPSPAATRIGVTTEITALTDPEKYEGFIVWSIEDPSIAEISTTDQNKITVIGKSLGTTKIVAKDAYSNITAESELTVTERNLSDNIAVTAEIYNTALNRYDDEIVIPSAGSVYTQKIFSNQDIKLNAHLTADSGDTSDDTIIWEITNNENNYITLPNYDPNEKIETNSLTVHGTSLGTATVTAYAKSNPETKITFNIEVAKSCDKINIQTALGDNITARSLDIDNTLQLVAVLTTNDPNNPDNHGDAVKSWTSSNTKVAEISNTGLVNPKMNGTSTITVTTLSNKTATLKLTVFTTSNVYITGGLDKNSDSPKVTTTLKEGGKSTANLTATVYNENEKSAGTSNNIDCFWSSSNEKVATVSEKGVVTALSGGNTTITVKSGSKTYSCEVIVNDPNAVKGIYGDIDGDSKVTSADALNILRYSVKLEKFNDNQVKLADVNKDGNVDSLDSLTVLRYSVGLIDEGAVTGTEENDFSK